MDLKRAIRRSFGDVRQTSPICGRTVSLGYQSVAPSDLDLRQVRRAPERRGHEVQSRSNLGPGRRPWCRTGTLRRVPRPRLKAPAAVGGTSSMKDFIRRRTAHRRMRSDLVVPVLDPRQRCAEGSVAERDELVREPLFLEGADEPLLHGDAAMPVLRQPVIQAASGRDRRQSVRSKACSRASASTSSA
jgi:hypothetical protein